MLDDVEAIVPPDIMHEAIAGPVTAVPSELGSEIAITFADAMMLLRVVFP